MELFKDRSRPGQSLALIALLVASVFSTLPARGSGLSSTPLGQSPGESEAAPFWENSSTLDLFSIGLQPSSTYGFIGLTLDFNALLNTTGGAIDASTTRSASVSALVPPNASLSLDVLGQTARVAVPPLIGSVVNIPVPGLGYLVPIVNVGFDISISMTGSLSGVSSIVGNGSGGAGSVSWVSSGSRPFTIDAGPAPGTAWANLNEVTYDWSLGIVATGCVITCYSIDLLPYVPLGKFTGSVAGTSTPWSVVSRPSISSVVVNPSEPSLGQAVELDSQVQGGAGSMGFDYVGLPANCSGTSTSIVVCTDPPVGSYSVEVRATDQQGVSSTSNVAFEVAEPPSPSNPVDLGGTGGWGVVAIVGIATLLGLGVILIVIVSRRRRAR
jgi:hypothetical protein